jgi:hypothetical protein
VIDERAAAKRRVWIDGTRGRLREGRCVGTLALLAPSGEEGEEHEHAEPDKDAIARRRSRHAHPRWHVVALYSRPF